MKRLLTPPLAVFATLCLAACGADAPTPTLNCPNPAVLEQARTVTLFLPGRQDVAAEVSTARITGIAGSCRLLRDKNLLRVTFRAGFTATNGPANNGAKLTLPYLVAISEGDNIVSKTLYGITLGFDGNVATTGATSKPITVELPNVPESTGVDVLLGFQMTPDQLAYAAAHPDGT